MIEDLAQLEGYSNIWETAVAEGVDVKNTYSRLQFATTYAMQNKTAVILAFGEDKSGVRYRVYDENPRIREHRVEEKNLSVILPNGNEVRYFIHNYNSASLVWLADLVKEDYGLKDNPSMFFTNENPKIEDEVKPIATEES